MEAMLDGTVTVSRSAEETAHALDALLADEEERLRRGHLGFRLVHRGHSCAQRLRDVFAAIGRPLPAAGDWPRVSVLLCTNRPHYLEQAVSNYAAQTYPNRELILVLNSSRFDRAAAEALAARVPRARVMQLDESHTLGQCLNAAAALAAGDYLAKMDDDDLYGPEFLWDLVLAARFSRAHVTGKGVYHVYMAGPELMGLRTVSREHGMVQRGLGGGTLLVRREVLDAVQFQSVRQGTDTRFLYDCEAEGFTFYSCDRFNYVMVRQSDPNLHTWPAGERELLRFCQDVRKGLDLSRAMI
jgi:glycosyltransferase involved in cell wall biosynthesis